MLFVRKEKYKGKVRKHILCLYCQRQYAKKQQPLGGRNNERCTCTLFTWESYSIDFFEEFIKCVRDTKYPVKVRIMELENMLKLI